MIKTNELRLGNWINDAGDGNGQVLVIEAGDGKSESSFITTTANNLPIPDDYFNAIPLNEEILLACGFEKKVESRRYTSQEIKQANIFGETKKEMRYVNYRISIGRNDWDQDFYLEIFDPVEAFDYIKIGSNDTPISTCQIPRTPQSVHQLQNLYFALTGEELEVKL